MPSATKAPRVDIKAARAATTGAQLARALGRDGKAVRARLRSMGVRLSKGDKLTRATVDKVLTAYGVQARAPRKAKAAAAPASDGA